MDLGPEFEKVVRPFLKRNCVKCHNEDNMMSGVRVDVLDSALFEDRHLKLWSAIRHRVEEGTMPPKGLPQPNAEDRRKVVAWISQGLEMARLRPAPKNGSVRRLTVAQYRNTLRELLLLDDDLTEALPPDAVSKDGFLNNKDTLQLSPLLTEAYFEIAETALNRAIVADPAAKPKIQNFRMDFGRGVNKNPYPDQLILGANSMLLDNRDFEVHNGLSPKGKNFAFDPAPMRTHYKFIEGYQGNDTVRGWREYDSIYHSVFADVRGSRGYPKGHPYDLVPGALLLRPAIPNDETFEADGTYGPKANFKISLRELPDDGRFRVIVTAAKYNDGLLLDAGATAAQDNAAGAVVVANPKSTKTVTIPKAGIYQVDVHASTKSYVRPAAVAAERVQDGLIGTWKSGDTASRSDAIASVVGKNDFTISAWVKPQQLRKSAVVIYSGGRSHGWQMEINDYNGVLRFGTTGPDGQSTGSVVSAPGAVKVNMWQHVAAVVQRSGREIRVYVNGYPVGRAEIGPVDLDDSEKSHVHLGAYPNGNKDTRFPGELEEVRLHKRAMSAAEIQTMVLARQQLVESYTPPAERLKDVRLTLGTREFTGSIRQQPAFLVVRLDAGPLAVRAEHTGVTAIDRLVLTPVGAEAELAKKFAAFEKRVPKLGVHVGLRRDCGSTFAPVGGPQVVANTGGRLQKYVFEGAIRNFPSPEVEKDNVNYLAGVREIAVRSEYTDGRDMPRLMIQSVEFEGPYYDMWPPASHRNIFASDFARPNDRAAYARHILKSFATRAYRRPVTAAEEASLVAVYEKSMAGGRGFQESVKDALTVVLTSPQFLFLIENSSTPEPEPLDGYELASKLSYFLWNGPPDRTLLQLASAGTLRQRLDAEVTRMIADSRFARFTQEFGFQWLSLDKFAVLEPDRKRYPQMNRHNRTQLMKEPVQFLHYAMRQNLPVRNLIQADFVLANEAVASYYDLGDKTESGFDFVAIPNSRGRELGGLLTQAALMAGLSDGRESNPVKRGAWLARKIVAEPPDDPPPNVPALKDDPAEKLTLRQRIERHRSQPGCVQCHLKIDPWGVAFEEYDAGGRLKKEPVDARSTLPDKTEVAGIADLRKYLAEDRADQVAFSVLKHLTIYANGRSLTYNESNYLKEDGRAKLKAGGYRMQDLLRYVVNSKAFLEK